ncbi:MAG: hypothetical protein OYH77_05325 [Pseudomonadota bacterium]|nr:hypothetical protein [Pseudomonadota bacterium]
MTELWEKLEWNDKVGVTMILYNSVGLDVLKIPASSDLKKYVNPLLRKAEKLKKNAISPYIEGAKPKHIRGLMSCVLKLWCLRQLAHREMVNQSGSKDASTEGVQPLMPDRIAKNMVSYAKRVHSVQKTSKN